MTRQAAFENARRHLKGALHCHTTRSDGKGTPEEVIRYRDRLFAVLLKAQGFFH